MANPDHLSRLRGGVAAWNRWRQEARDIRPDLRRAGLNTDSNNLHRFDGGDFREADFQFAEIWSASLQGADLRDANLSQVDIYFCELNNADLRGADLTEARITYTDLSGANLAGTKFGGGVVIYVDLSHVAGLAEVDHRRSTTIDTNVFEMTAEGLGENPSAWPAVEAFFRGAGVPEHIVEHYRGRVGVVPDFASAFISYSHADTSFAYDLYEALQARGVRCWLDKHEVLPGDDLYDALAHGIRDWDRFLLCCSATSLQSWWVENEIDAALEKERQLTLERKSKSLVILPLDLDGFMFTAAWQSGRAPQLRSRVAADFRGWSTDRNKFDLGIASVLRALRRPGSRAGV